MRAKILVTAILLGLLTQPLSAQWMMRPPPASSPYWWTLTDAVSPQELRAELQSPAKNRERLVKAIADDEYPEVSAEKLREVRLFLDGSRHPDLVHMWNAFSILADRVPFHASEEELGDDLTTYDLSPAGVDQVLEAVLDYKANAQAVIDRIDQEQRTFVREVLVPARTEIGNKATDEAILQHNITRLAQASGLQPPRVRGLYETWLRDPWAEAGITAIVELKTALSEEDWKRLRQFLLHEVAPSVHYDHFGRRPLR